MKGFFITGTDTGIGKTYVSRLIADSLAHTLPVSYFKPVQSGAERDGQGALRAPDFEYVMAGKAQQTYEQAIHVPYLFEPACSPHLAAEMSNTVIDLAYIMRCYNLVAESVSCMLVEGAGGLYVPLNRQKYIIDIIGLFELPVILVTANRLGTLNHTFLSIKALQSYGYRVAGVVLNEYSGESVPSIREDNKITIARYIEPIPLIDINFQQTENECMRELFNDLLEQQQ